MAIKLKHRVINTSELFRIDVWPEDGRHLGVEYHKPCGPFPLIAERACERLHDALAGVSRVELTRAVVEAL